MLDTTRAICDLQYQLTKIETKETKRSHSEIHIPPPISFPCNVAPPVMMFFQCRFCCGWFLFFFFMGIYEPRVKSDFVGCRVVYKDQRHAPGDRGGSDIRFWAGSSLVLCALAACEAPLLRS